MEKVFCKRKPFNIFSHYLDVKIAYLNQKYAKKNVRTHNHRIAIFAYDHIGISINQFGIYERDELHLLFDFLSPCLADLKKKSALDIGANIGNHTLYFSKFFEKVCAFEPNPSTYELLTFNTKLVENVISYNVGLSDTKATATLVQNNENIGGSYIDQGQPNRLRCFEEVQIKLDTLDNLRDAFGNVGLVKIDIEGFEHKALLGGSQFFDEVKPIVLMEQHTSEFHNGTTPSLEFLSNLGYRFCWTEQGSNTPF